MLNAQLFFDALHNIVHMYITIFNIIA